MSSHRWSKFWWSDWLGDLSLRRCSPAARALWMDMLCLAHEASVPGHVLINGQPATDKDLSEISRISHQKISKLLSELEINRVFSRTESGVIYSRRMVRDAQRSDDGKHYISKRYPKNDPPTFPGSPTRIPTRGATRDPSREPNSLEAEAEAEAESEERKTYKNSSFVPPAGSDCDARTRGIVVSLAKTLRHVEYAPGRSPRMTVNEQIEAIEQKPRPKTAHLTPEQLAIVRKRTAS